MNRKIVVGHDLHAGGEDALALAKVIAAATDASLVIAGIFPVGGLPHGFEAQWREDESRVLTEVQRIADEAGAEAEAFPSGSPARGLDELVEEIDGDLVIVGSSRHSRVGEALAGNVALGLLHGSPCAVGIAPRGYAEEHDGLTSVVVGFDGSPEAELALNEAVHLARAADVPVRLVAVAEPPPVVYGKGMGVGGEYQALEAGIEDRLRERLDVAIASVPDGVAKEASLVTGDPASVLSEEATDGSILVLGSRGYGPLRRVLLGSVSSEIVGSAQCPVLVHPRGAKASGPNPLRAAAASGG
jgi:nucleotide-binding universal stress UspA family protein